MEGFDAMLSDGFHDFFRVEKPPLGHVLHIDDALEIARHERALMKIAAKYGGMVGTLILAALGLLGAARAAKKDDK